MADGIEYNVATKFTGDSELRAAANAIERVGDESKRAMRAAGDASDHAKRSWTEFKSQIDVISGALGKVGNVAGGVYSALGEGAELIAARDRFDNLAASINTTGDALLGKLREATSGMMTDAQLIASGTDLMSLGLAKTEESAVRLATVIGKLGWDMQVLTLTLANNSMARLDSLGLSMEDVKARAEALRDAGHGLDEAFDLAVLEAGEAKIALLGDSADTTAGKLKIMETAIANAGDKFKVAFAQGMAEGLAAAVENADQLTDAIGRVGQASGDLLAQIGGTAAFQFAADSVRKELEALGVDLTEVDRQIRDMERRRGANFIELGFDPRDAEIAAERYRILTEALEEYYNQQRRIGGVREYIPDLPRQTEQVRDFSDELTRFVQLSNSGVGAIQKISDLDTGNWQYAALGLREVNQALIEQATIATKARDAWSDYVAAIEGRGGELFADFVQEAEGAKEVGERWGLDLKQAMFDAMREGGAGANPLAALAEEMGISAESINAAFDAMQQQTIVENIAQAARDGQIAWADFTSTVENAIRILNGGYAVDLGQRDMPAPEDRGFREGYQEDFIANLPSEHTIVIDANTELAVAAVNEAKGLVDGFVSPAKAYEAVMDMDISAVETGTAQATRLINGVPTRRTITINWEQSGADVLAALRALGILP